MTKAEFNAVFTILKGECFIPADDMGAWIDAIRDCDFAEVMRNLQQYRDAKKYGVRIVPSPMDVRVECKNYHGYDRWTWSVIQAIKEGGTDDWSTNDD